MGNDNIKAKKIILYLILSILTLGIYGIYWQYLIIKDIYFIANKTDNPLLDTLLSICTLGLYDIFIWYKISLYLCQIHKSKSDVPIESSGVLVVLAFFYQKLICYCIAQNDINNLLVPQSEESPIEKTIFV